MRTIEVILCQDHVCLWATVRTRNVLQWMPSWGR